MTGLIAVALALLVAGVVAIVAVRGGEPDPRAEGTRGAVTEITITGRDIRFDPGELRLRAGEPVRLVFVNEGSIDHDLSILGISASEEVVEASAMRHGETDHAGAHGGAHADTMMTPGTVHLAAAPGERASIEFTPKAGAFEVVCTIAGHREAGMAGAAVVE
jgi:uncharacterized cupredoxin-like copper-binding protein